MNGDSKDNKKKGCKPLNFTKNFDELPIKRYKFRERLFINQKTRVQIQTNIKNKSNVPSVS